MMYLTEHEVSVESTVATPDGKAERRKTHNLHENALIRPGYRFPVGGF